MAERMKRSRGGQLPQVSRETILTRTLIHTAPQPTHELLCFGLGTRLQDFWFDFPAGSEYYFLQST